MYFTDHKQRKGKEKGKERGVEGGSGLQFGCRFLGARTLNAGTWHWLRESLAGAAASTGSAFISLGTGGEIRAGGKGIRVEAEVDERGPGFLPRRERRAGAMALRPARSSCASKNASPRR